MYGPKRTSFRLRCTQGERNGNKATGHRTGVLLGGVWARIPPGYITPSSCGKPKSRTEPCPTREPTGGELISHPACNLAPQSQSGRLRPRANLGVRPAERLHLFRAGAPSTNNPSPSSADSSAPSSAASLIANAPRLVAKPRRANRAPRAV